MTEELKRMNCILKKISQPIEQAVSFAISFYSEKS